ncbi:AraC family transcriptional regulator [Blautia schinkii]|nr:AraC family transcriptional regulator [Blautia schinkii]
MTQIHSYCNLFRSIALGEENLLEANCIRLQIKYEQEKDHTAYIFKNRESSKLHNSYDQELQKFSALLTFSSTSHFIRIFREETGMTPRQYQQKYFRRHTKWSG